MNLEYMTLEWIWDGDSLRINRPNQPEKQLQGSYQQVVDTLTSLGSEGWDDCSCVSSANWLFWTLKRQK